MASLTLKNIMKIYPYSADEEKKNKKKKKKNEEEPEKKVNLQITEKGVVAAFSNDVSVALVADGCNTSICITPSSTIGILSLFSQPAMTNANVANAIYFFIFIL